MDDLRMLADLAAGKHECQAPVIHAAGILRCLETQQGTALMVSSVLAALGYGALVTGRHADMIGILRHAIEGMEEDIQDLAAAGRLPQASPGDGDLYARIDEAVAAYRALSPEARAAHDQAQRQSWVDGNLAIDRMDMGETVVMFRRPAPQATGG